jgi:hypothetical protein
VTQRAHGLEDGKVNFDGPTGFDGQPMPASESQPSSLSPNRLAELRMWVARHEHIDPQIDHLVASRILERGDL